MNKILSIAAISALTLGGLILGASGAKAYRGDPSITGPNYSPERHEAMTQAFENNDYNAWSELMQGKGKVTQVINEGNFVRFSEMHKFMLEGNTEEAAKIRTELGLGVGGGMRQGQANGRNAR